MSVKGMGGIGLFISEAADAMTAALGLRSATLLHTWTNTR